MNKEVLDIGASVFLVVVSVVLFWRTFRDKEMK